MRRSTGLPSMRRTETGPGDADRPDGPGGLPDRDGVAADGPGTGGWLPWLPEPVLQPRPALLLSAALLACLCALLSWWGGPSPPAAPEPPGFNLRADVSSFKLDTTSAEAPPGPPAPAPRTELDRQ